jgi:DNA-binding transcriptional LysR family regulator
LCDFQQGGNVDYSWDDLRLVLAIIDAGSVNGASRKLGVHHATVLRRLDIFERQLGVVLFERHATGYRPTALAEAIAERATGVSEDFQDIFRLLDRSDLRLSGTIRLATTDFLAQTLVPKILQSFSNSHKDITVEVVVSTQFASLSRRDADVALRVMPLSEIKLNLVTHAIAEIEYGAFAHDRLSKIKDIPWVVEEDAISRSSVSRWSTKARQDARVVARTNNMMSKFALVSAGVGAGILPVFLAKTAKNLECVRQDKSWRLGLCYTSHADLASLPRIKTLRKHLIQTLNDQTLN